MPDLSLEFVNIDALTPHPQNSKVHGDDQLDQIVAAMRAHGWTRPVITDENHVILAGHGAVLAAQRYYESGDAIKDVPFNTAPVVVKVGLSDDDKRAMIIAENRIAENSKWDKNILAQEVIALSKTDLDLGFLGFKESEMDKLLTESLAAGLKDDDDIPAAEDQDHTVTRAGEIWILDQHRVMCGDSIEPLDVDRLAADSKARLLHADPVYGMGKTNEGVANDNLYGEKLDRFQLGWWDAYRPWLEANASAYIWGNPLDLWRLWFVGIPGERNLSNSERLTFRNEIVWDKGDAGAGGVSHKGADYIRHYPKSTERCLFFMLGQQEIGNANADDYWEGWEPFRTYLVEQANIMQWGPKDIKKLCGVGMYSHWFTKSQWTLIPEKHYNTLKEAANGKAFEKTYRQLKNSFDQAKSGGADSFDALRAYFNNSHDLMTETWEYPRVKGAERHGHATPKPVAMMERVMVSSLPAGGLCFEPFGGSGSTLIAAEKTGRRCYTMELQANYVDVIVKRWQQFTGKRAILESSGQTFDELEQERIADDGQQRATG